MKNKKILLLLIFILSFSCIAAENNNSIKENNDFSYYDVYDPLEPLNKRIYYFNYQFDKYIFIPTTKIYHTITPRIVRNGVNNFFCNTKNISTTGNSLAQFKLRKAMKALGRFTINIAFGFGGLYNAANDFGMPTPYEDFGLTLAHYGIPKGPYLVLPILGPSNLRDTLGLATDWFSTRVAYSNTHVPDMNKPEVTLVQSINKRDHIPFRYYGSGSPFEYEYVRFLYQKYRKLQSEVGNEVF